MKKSEKSPLCPEVFEKKIYDQKQLIEISKALNSNLNLKSLIESILDTCLAQSQSMQIGIFLYPKVSSQSMVLHPSVIGFEVEAREDYKISSKSLFLPCILQHKHPMLLSEISRISDQDTFDFNDVIATLSTLGEELLLVPLKNRGAVNGLIVLGAKNTGQPYSAQEKEFLGDIASIAAIAVANARLYELATVDMMTQLKTHNFFQIKLRDNIQKKKDDPEYTFSLIMADIDHFKKFNDTYGHQLGDKILAKVAGVLIRNARGADIPCRYGGEEFSIILVNTKLEASVIYAERVRKAVENTTMENPTDIGENILRVTISIGVVEYDMKKDTCQKALIERCDRALYEAKKAGRNLVIKAI